MTPQELARFELWWRGPAWLIYSSSEWPTQQDSAQEQIQSLSTFESTSDSPAEDGLLSSLEKYSNFSKIVRVVAYCLRWKRTHPHEAPQPLLGISAHEYAQAKNSLLKLIQAQYFSSEISCISTGKQLSPRSMLARLSPFIDDHGLIRVGGRLQNTTLPFAERHPIILPGRCYFVKLLVEETHRPSLHGVVQLMKSLLNRTCWIIRGSRLVTAVYRKCITCTRFGATPMQQPMAPLPSDRLAPGRPFSIIGLDYAEPFPILFSKGRGAKSTKGYVAIFICLIVKAVHIEVVSDLTSESFMAAYSRFSVRRGLSSTIYSDNGTTFKGADAELKRLFNQSSMFSKEVFSHLAARGTDWKFIPPRAPHFGGLWEAAVRSFKYHLRRVVGSTNFTFEEFATLTAKIEACLNSRPVCPLSNDADDPVALTPGHFITGSSLLAYPEPVFDLAKRTTYNTRWQLVNQLRDSFWTGWRKEVFAHLQQRNKWLKPQINLREGDLVMVTDELSPPAAWPLAIITRTHPGKDGLIRIVSLRTSKSTFIRPIVKLIRVPTDADAEAIHTHFSATISLPPLSRPSCKLQDLS